MKSSESGEDVAVKHLSFVEDKGVVEEEDGEHESAKGCVSDRRVRIQIGCASRA